MPRPNGAADHTARARTATTPRGIVKYRRVIATATPGRRAISLNDVLPRSLPVGTYKLTIRLARRTPTGRHTTSEFLSIPFTVSDR